MAMEPSAVSKRSLILLPPPPHPPSYPVIKAAYHAPLLSAFTTILRQSQGNTGQKFITEIVLPCDHLYHSKAAQPRSASYRTTQSLLAQLYKLICVISAKNSIPLEYGDGVDARIILVSYPRDGRFVHSSQTQTHTDTEGPVITIETLARSGRNWESIFSVESEAGEQILRNFTNFFGKEVGIKRVRGGIVQYQNSLENDDPIAHNETFHKSVAVGGTFDHLHIGHKLLLTMTAYMVEPGVSELEADERKLTIGITGDELLKNKQFRQLLESWRQRQENVHSFLMSIMLFSPSANQEVRMESRSEDGPNGRRIIANFPSKLKIEYVEIGDPFGPTVTDEAISCLVISGETRSGGEAVNNKRKEKGWLPLEVLEVDVLDNEEDDAKESKAKHQEHDQEFHNKLSSTAIRRSLAAKSA
jgi:phosphopantetheine adenylyltransferase